MPVPNKPDVGRILLIQNYSSVETASAKYLPIHGQSFYTTQPHKLFYPHSVIMQRGQCFYYSALSIIFFLYLLLCIQTGVFNKKINSKLQVYLWIVKMDDILNVDCKLVL